MNFGLALQALAQHEIEFLVVAGVAAIAHGASTMTRDLGILYRLTPENVERLVRAFQELDAVSYGDPRRLPFEFSHLNNTGHHLAETRIGRIDALGSIGNDGEIVYEDVIDDAITLEAFGVSFRCIALERLIAVKEALGRPKELLAVMELKAVASQSDASLNDPGTRGGA